MNGSQSPAGSVGVPRQGSVLTGNAPPRPGGEVIWAHATSESRLAALGDIGARLKSQRGDPFFLMSARADLGATISEPPTECDWFEVLASDQSSAMQRFLSHWQPDICLWAGGELMPNLIGRAADRGIPMLLIDASEGDFAPRRRWLRDRTRSSLDRFDIVLTTGNDAVEALRRSGARDDRIRLGSRLRAGTIPPVCVDEELAQLSQTLAGRPVWLAAHLRADEFAAVLAAHRLALRLLHRLLLVITVADPADLGALKRALEISHIRNAEWRLDGIEDSVQAVWSEDAGDLGLWYRLAPLTFLGGSLAPDAGGNNPLHAAALGSAVLYGPNVRNFREDYARLSSAGAARTVHDAETLGAAVVQLIAPDKAAAMALAGWEVVTEGAEMIDEVLEIMHDMLDRRTAENARA